MGKNYALKSEIIAVFGKLKPCREIVETRLKQEITPSDFSKYIGGIRNSAFAVSVREACLDIIKEARAKKL